jgi:hypothetical protein
MEFLDMEKFTSTVFFVCLFVCGFELGMLGPASSLSLLLSLVVITAVAFLSETATPFVGSILATAPTGTSLALFLASRPPAAVVADPASASAETQHRLIAATQGLVRGTLSTLCFSILARTSALAGHGLWVTLGAGFAGWSGALLVLGWLY